MAQEPDSPSPETLSKTFKIPEKFKVPEQEPPRNAPPKKEFVSHELLVKYKDTKEFPRTEAREKWFAHESVGARAFSRNILSNQQRVMDQMGENLREKYKKEYNEDVFKPRQDFPLLGFQLVEISSEKATEELYKKLKEDDQVDTVMLNYKAYLLSHRQAGDRPKDEYWVEHAEPPDNHAVLWGLEKINMQEAWGKAGSWNGTGTEKVVVAVIDSGIKTDHPDLASNLWVNQQEKIGHMGIDDEDWGEFIDDIHGVNLLPFAEEVKCDKPQKVNDLSDEINHGTGVSGVIAAAGSREGGNGSGIVGVHGNGEVKIMTIKVFCAGSETREWTSLSVLLKAIEYSFEMHAHMINASWTLAGGLDAEEVEGLREVIQAANDQGVLFIAAAGNGGENHDEMKVYPSSFKLDNVLAVAATHRGDDLRVDSDMGKLTVHLGAPGHAVMTTSSLFQPTRWAAGTSIAAPFVTGCAAFLQSQRISQGLPLLSPLELKKTIMKTVEPLPALKEKVISGGSLNCLKAYELAFSS